MPSAPCTRRINVLMFGVHMKVLVIENSSAICARLLALLGEHGRYEGKGCVTSSTAALELIKACQPDAVLLGLRLADGSGFTVLKNLRRHQHTLPVILLSDRDEWQYRAHAQDLGAVAVLNIASQFEAILPTLDRL